MREDGGLSPGTPFAAGRSACAPGGGARRAGASLRPELIASIARWWHEHLCAGGPAVNPPTAVLTEVSERFGCSSEEAIRGICVGEQLYWGGA